MCTTRPSPRSRVLFDEDRLFYRGGPENAEIINKETLFGIRHIVFDTQNGFSLNGKTVLPKGGCVHHDNGLLGAAASDRTEERRVELLKAGGFNAVRWAHNPPSPAFLNTCDRLGMLVIDEAFDMWAVAKNPQDYHLYFNEWRKKRCQKYGRPGPQSSFDYHVEYRQCNPRTGHTCRGTPFTNDRRLCPDIGPHPPGYSCCEWSDQRQG